MNRRTLIKNMAAVGVTTTIAGCSSILGDTNSDNPTNTPTDKTTNPVSKGDYELLAHTRPYPENVTKEVNGRTVTLSFTNGGDTGIIHTIMGYGSIISDSPDAIDHERGLEVFNTMDKFKRNLDGELVVNKHETYTNGEKASFEMTVPEGWDAEKNAFAAAIPEQFSVSLIRTGPAVEVEARLYAYSTEQVTEEWVQIDQEYGGYGLELDSKMVTLEANDRQVVAFEKYYNELSKYSFTIQLFNPKTGEPITYTLSS